jgi:hypothetical protein
MDPDAANRVIQALQSFGSPLCRFAVLPGGGKVLVVRGQGLTEQEWDDRCSLRHSRDLATARGRWPVIRRPQCACLCLVCTVGGAQADRAKRLDEAASRVAALAAGGITAPLAGCRDRAIVLVGQYLVSKGLRWLARQGQRQDRSAGRSGLRQVPLVCRDVHLVT